MAIKFQTKIGARDIDILTALDRCPLTTAQLLYLSQTFEQPFGDENNLRRRLRNLAKSQLIRSFPYALISDGRSPRYFKLTRGGYQMLYGKSAPLPRRRYLHEIAAGHHHHTHSLAEALSHLVVNTAAHHIDLRYFARENSLRLQSDGFTLYPDCAFQMVGSDSRPFNFVVELDNGTERVRSKLDIESIERKLRGYDAHQANFQAFDQRRFVVLFITTRSAVRLDHILDLAQMISTKKERTLFMGIDLKTIQNSDPFCEAVFRDQRGLKRMLLPMPAPSERKTEKVFLSTTR